MGSQMVLDPTRAIFRKARYSGAVTYSSLFQLIARNHSYLADKLQFHTSEITPPEYIWRSILVRHNVGYRSRFAVGTDCA